MKQLSQRNPYLLSVFVIGCIWLWQILSLLFPHEPVLNFYIPIISLKDNLPVAAMITMGKGVCYFILVILLLRGSNDPFASLGFQREQLARQLSIGALFGLAILIANSTIILPLIEKIFPTLNVSNAVLFSSSRNIAILFVLGIVKGGFLEELWRIFVLTRFEKVFQQSHWKKAGLLFALIASSIIFGLGHAYQGSSAIIGTAVIGSLNGLVYLRKRSAIEAMTAHAVFDMLAVALGATIHSGH